MKSGNDLRRFLRNIEGKGYKAYKQLEGVYDIGEYTLFIDHVQGDPFAAPSRVRIRVVDGVAGFPADTYSNKSREIALRDFLTRRFSENSTGYKAGRRGSGKSGLIAIDRPGQEVLERSSVLIKNGTVEARFFMGLPAFGRRIAAREAEVMFFEEIPVIVKRSLLYRSLDRESLYRHIETVEDADYLRDRLDELGLAAFVSEGAVLPRASGIDDRPMKKGTVIRFEVPESLLVEVELPNRGRIKGMGIPAGITLITGGGYHGKSTLLNAIELGIYNHIPGDGRELVVTDPLAVKIRAEDGRRIERVDISPFISRLPFGQDTAEFSTENASGSTSQAANIIEAVELGARLLLIDEDTSATNFMIRDHRMQELVSKEKEPITPFIDKVRQLYTDYGISTILVIGGSGDYFDVADTVICMEEYRPIDVTEKALEIARRYRAERKAEGGEHFGRITERIPIGESFDPKRGRREVKITPRGLSSISFGTHQIDLGAVEQLVDASQTRAIGDAIYYATRYMDGRRRLSEVLGLVMRDIEREGLDILSRTPAGDYAAFRGIELAAAINRLRTLKVRQVHEIHR
jgi:predicted ABC-class ATPase